MGYCVDCGSPIPDGQRTCSMCYGDPWHGQDGYYMAELEREWLEQDYQHALEDHWWASIEDDEAIPLGERPPGFNGDYGDIPY